MVSHRGEAEAKGEVARESCEDWRESWGEIKLVSFSLEWSINGSQCFAMNSMNKNLKETKGVENLKE